jgi:hypothetical protein
VMATEPRGIRSDSWGNDSLQLVDGGSMSFTHVSPRRIAATIGLFAAGIAFFVPLPMSASSESACEAMARWATEYERTTPAPTLDDLAKFDRAHRVAIFNAVSPDVKANLFQEQLRRFSERPDLTAAQRALIAEGLTLITPAFYRKDPAASIAARQFWPRVETSFTSPDQRRVWIDIGSNVAPQLALTSSGLGRSVLASPIASGAANCFCNVNENDCGGGGWDCFSTGCTSSQTGCGWGAGARCDGECIFHLPSPLMAGQ